MNPLIFATNNRHKVDELRSAVGDSPGIITLAEAGIAIDIPEPHDTLEANASEKSGVIHRLTGMNCFSEDTGLEVDALNGEPGVRSARYAEDEPPAGDQPGQTDQRSDQRLDQRIDRRSEQRPDQRIDQRSEQRPDQRSDRHSGQRPDQRNIDKLLHRMQGVSDRRAKFRTVISLILDEKEYQFEGVCRGRILENPVGDQGFGYDPVFAPDGDERSFAQMTLTEKSLYSHRRIAADRLIDFLKAYVNPQPIS